jgi:hypothetical protein
MRSGKTGVRDPVSQVGFRAAEEKRNRVLTTSIRTLGCRTFAIAAVAAALAGPGCGGDDEPVPPAEDQELVERAMDEIERTAAAKNDPVKDRYIPGPKKFKLVCLTTEQARAAGVPPDHLQCHVEAFSTRSKQRPGSVYIESEDYRVPVEPDGTVGDAFIVNGYRISYFLRRDHRLGCSVGKTPQNRCKAPF